jgi:hypothetical protein
MTCYVLNSYVSVHRLEIPADRVEVDVFGHTPSVACGKAGETLKAHAAWQAFSAAITDQFCLTG